MVLTYFMSPRVVSLDNFYYLRVFNIVSLNLLPIFLTGDEGGSSCSETELIWFYRRVGVLSRVVFR
jgi:hypothetical protein